MEKESTIAEKEESKEVAHPEKDESREEAGVDYCKTIYSIAKEVKGLGCRDFFFLYPLVADSKLVNAYQDHLNTIQTVLKVMEGADPALKKQGEAELLLRLKAVMKEIKEKIIDPIQQGTDGDGIKTFSEYATKWNNQVREMEKIDEAFGFTYKYGKPLKVDIPALEEKNK